MFSGVLLYLVVVQICAVPVRFQPVDFNAKSSVRPASSATIRQTSPLVHNKKRSELKVTEQVRIDFNVASVKASACFSRSCVHSCDHV